MEEEIDSYGRVFTIKMTCKTVMEGGRELPEEAGNEKGMRENE